jgi:zinc protease
MADGPRAWDQTLTETDGLYTFTIVPRRGADTFKPINTNGSQRGGRPIIEFFPRRLKNVQIVEGADLAPLIADDFLLIPDPSECDPDHTYRVRFRAETIR